MVAALITGNSHFNMLNIPLDKHKKCIEAASTYEWEEITDKDAIYDSFSSKIRNISPSNTENDIDKYEFFKCNKTNVYAFKVKGHHLMMTDENTPLSLTADDQDVKDIIL